MFPRLAGTWICAGILALTRSSSLPLRAADWEAAGIWPLSVVLRALR